VFAFARRMVHCSEHRNCTACSSAFPDCAWCASSAECLETTQELRDTFGAPDTTWGARSDSVHVVYSIQEYEYSYGRRARMPSGLVRGNECGVWLFSPDSCGHVEDFCSPLSEDCRVCTRVTGCGFSPKDSVCKAGTASGAFFMSAGMPCVRQTPLLQQGCAFHDQWLFANFSNYYDNQDQIWESPCVERCRSGAPERITGSRGVLSLGNPSRRVAYASGSNCSWMIIPNVWPVGFYLRLSLILHQISHREDILRLRYLHEIKLGSDAREGEEDQSFLAGEVIGELGCRERPCNFQVQAFVSRPVLVTFDSQELSVVDLQKARGAWSVEWALVHPAGSKDSGDTEMIGLSLWLPGLLSTLVPLLALLAFAKWRCHRRRAGGTAGTTRQRRISSSVQRVDIQVLEQVAPECRPFIVTERQEGQPEVPCSICLGDLEVGEEARALPCRHEFHRQCIDVWFDRSGACPMCRQAVMPWQAASHNPSASSVAGSVVAVAIGSSISAPRSPVDVTSTPLSQAILPMGNHTTSAQLPVGRSRSVGTMSRPSPPLGPPPQPATTSRASSGHASYSFDMGAVSGTAAIADIDIAEHGEIMPELSSIAPVSSDSNDLGSMLTVVLGGLVTLDREPSEMTEVLYGRSSTTPFHASGVGDQSEVMHVRSSRPFHASGIGNAINGVHGEVDSSVVNPSRGDDADSGFPLEGVV